MTAPTRLPLTVIGGFLGAGKTTLLNRWLADAGGQRLAVLVNDFGAINIDAALLSARTGETIALSNGCVCCQIGDDLSAALMRVLDAPGRFDAVVIEASGVSDPWRIAQLGRADPGLSLDGVIVLVDASVALAQSRDPLLADTLERQLKAADLVVVNKCDSASADDRQALLQWIAAVAGPVPCFETSQAEVPLAMLSGLALPEARPQRRPSEAGHAHQLAGVVGTAHEHGSNHDHDHDHGAVDHGQVFDTWSCRPAHRFDAGALRAWLAEPPAGLLRLKGLVALAEVPGSAPRWAEIQFAGRRGTVRPAAPSPDGAAVVAISLRGRLPLGLLTRAFGSNPALGSAEAISAMPAP